MSASSRMDRFAFWFGARFRRSAAIRGGVKDRVRDRARRRTRLGGLEALEGRAVLTAVVPVYSVSQNWGSGFQGQIQLTNKDTVTVPDWTVQFDLAANLTSVWDGAVVSHVGTRYTVKNAGWNANLPVGGSVAFGFVAAPGTTGPTTPTNWLINGQPLTSTPTGTAGGTTGGGTGGGTSGGTTGSTTGGTGGTTTSGTVGTLALAVTNDWGSGFTADLKAKNTSAGTLTDWRATIDYSGQISSIWNGSIESHSGTRYVLKPATWNASIASGATATIGFTASSASGVAKPSLVSLTGTVTLAPSGGSSGGSTSGSTGGTSTGTPPAPLAPAAASAWGAHVSAPYVDMTLYPMIDLAAAATASATKHFTLAFITADPSAKPAWGGYATYGVNTGGDFETKLRAAIVAVRSAGGDVSVSFGGAAGSELALKITDVTALKNAYRAVVDAYGLRRIDFDIEGAAVADKASVDRRWQAVAALQKDLAAAGKPLDVWATLPVLPQGLTADGLSVVTSAVKQGVSLAGVNVMAMDYGSWAAPNPQGKMGDYAIAAAESTFAQLKQVYGTTKTDAALWRMVGLTPMIGVNDLTDEVFDQTEAREVADYAARKQLGMLSFWSLNRDVASTTGSGRATALDSGIVQSKLEFAKIFAPFDS